jgi:hypothetical protein
MFNSQFVTVNLILFDHNFHSVNCIYASNYIAVFSNTIAITSFLDQFLKILIM